jgi:hypothetical protein
MGEPIFGDVTVNECVSLNVRKPKDKNQAERQCGQSDQQEEKFVPPQQIKKGFHGNGRQV